MNEITLSQRENAGSSNSEDIRRKCAVPVFQNNECIEKGKHHDLRHFLKDLLFYICQNDERLDSLSRKIISLRRNTEPRGAYFTEDIGVLTRNLMMHLRNNKHVVAFKFHPTLRTVDISQGKYSRKMLESEQGFECSRVLRWVYYRVRKHYLFLGSQSPEDFFMYLAYLSKFCVTLTLEGKPFNEIELIATIGAETIFCSWEAFPNYGLIQRFAEVKKFTLADEIFFVSDR